MSEGGRGRLDAEEAEEGELGGLAKSDIEVVEEAVLTQQSGQVGRQPGKADNRAVTEATDTDRQSVIVDRLRFA